MSIALSDAVWERVWTMKRGFDKERVDFKSNLAGLGAFQTELMEYSTGFRHGAAARNVLVGELITGTHFRQIPGLGSQATAIATGVVVPGPSMSVASWHHRPIFT